VPLWSASGPIARQWIVPTCVWKLSDCKNGSECWKNSIGVSVPRPYGLYVYVCSKSFWLCLTVVYWLLGCNKVPSWIEQPEYVTICYSRTCWTFDNYTLAWLLPCWVCHYDNRLSIVMIKYSLMIFRQMDFCRFTWVACAVSNNLQFLCMEEGTFKNVRQGRHEASILNTQIISIAINMFKMKKCTTFET
jgi:hypothetical protein